MTTGGRTALALGCVLGMVGFVALLALAVRAYPGGSWAAPMADGFAFWTNYWCDLMSDQAWNKAPNDAAHLAKGAFLALAGSLACFWPQAASLAPDRRVARLARRSGMVSTLAMVVMVAAPYPEYRVTHAASTIVAGGAALMASLLVVGGAFRTGRGGVVGRTCGALFVLAGLVNLVIYLGLVVRGGGSSVTMPVVQKVATLALVPWVLATLATARSSAIDSAADPGQTGPDPGGSP